MRRIQNKQNRIVVFDTTLRDGEQAPGFHMSAGKKLTMAQQLARLGVDVIEAGFPVSSPNDFLAVKQIADTVGRLTQAPEICGLARCVSADIQAVWNSVKGATRPRIHVFIATSAIHMKHKLHMSPTQVIEKIRTSVKEAAKCSPSVEFSAEDATRSEPSFLVEVVRAAIQAGATTVNIPDTVGYTTPHEYAELIRYLFKRVRDLDKVIVSVHAQNDLGMAVANSLSAIQAGARQVECTINGIGERAGNCSLEELVMNLVTRQNYYEKWTAIQTPELTASSRLLSELVEVAVPPNKPIVGANAFAHGSGVHQDGVMKNPLTYEIMNPADVGAEGTKIILTSRSGRRALFQRAEELGHRFKPSDQDRFYTVFKKLADQKKIVNDQELKKLIKSGGI